MRRISTLVVGLQLVACGSTGGGGDDADTPGGRAGASSVAGSGGGGAAAGGGGAGTAGGSGLAEEAVVSELPEADLARLCTWTTAQAEAYQQTWTAQRLCTLVGARLAASRAPADLAGARAQCATLRDTCLEDAAGVIVLPCSALSTCASTVGQVQAYYRESARAAEELGTCETLEAGALDELDADALSVLPNCTLVGTPRP
jgi:hypothetical protein